ncbi:hypothetical protein COCCADRAFT_110583, partial [Bipolaris zeicola 26-R-13]
GGGGGNSSGERGRGREMNGSSVAEGARVAAREEAERGVGGGRRTGNKDELF